MNMLNEPCMASETTSPSSLLTDNLPLLTGAPDGIQKLRELILELAVRGKLVPQDPNDEPASELLKRIAEEKTQLVADGKIKKQKPIVEIDEQEELFDLPAGWVWTRIGCLFTSLISGGTPSKSNPDFWNGPIPWASVKDLNVDRDLTFTQDSITEAGLAAGSKLAKKGDLIICTRMGLGKVAIAAMDVAINQDLKAVRLCSSVDIDFFLICFKTLRIIGTGMTVAGIKQELLLSYVIALPPLAEQHRIVAKVDELMALCDRLEAQQADAESAHARLVQALLDSLTQASDADDFAASWQRLAEHFHMLFTTESSIDALKQTLMQLAVMGKLVSQDPSDVMSDINAAPTLFRTKKKASLSNIDTLPFPIPSSWVWTSLGSLIVSGPTNGFSPKPSQIETGFRCLTLSSTTKGYFNGSCFKYVDITTDISKKYSIKKGDFLVQRANSIEYVGVSAIYDGEDDQYIYPDLMIRFRISEELNPSFIHLALSSVSVRSYFKNNATGTQGNMPKINQGTLVNALIPIPPLSEQHRIVTKFDQLMMLCDNLKDNLSQARRTLETLTNALVEQAVT
ncbi:restriction endonuclease subunit S [Pseudomonas luteola]|uniref:Restriction modification system DNA specificity domain-containing protein n=1 Tax=Pseudomonas luteola TaxID=47886 RepID=A0A2X2C430_PSELU|nr:MULTISPECIES: restriction endonuclease subunit S [Pseudomonas]SHJ75747.1 type I restriction enzyme, S subunit [Pseudomonas zeshuii]SPZ00296.1 restriction modification system DNA specificity domain-containing protein [Pseudomonas luteola]